MRDSVPAVELMTVAYKDNLGREFVPNPHPYVNFTILPSISGKPHLMRNQNIIMCRSLRRGGFTYKGKLLNPHEKPMQAMAWAIERFTKPGNFRFRRLEFLGSCILSLCAGSGTMLEASMQLGRDCLAVDIDGL